MGEKSGLRFGLSLRFGEQCLLFATSACLLICGLTQFIAKGGGYASERELGEEMELRQV